MLLRVPRLKRAVESAHRCHARHAGTRVIVERLPNGSIWRGVVDVFDLQDHASTDRCYAWMEQRGPRTVCVTRLKIPPLNSAQSAVRVALARRLLADRLPAH